MNHVPDAATRRWVSQMARARVTEDERRRFQRYEGHGMVAAIDKHLLEVEDISVSGMRLAVVDLPHGKTIQLKLIPREGSKLALNSSVPVEAEVVGERHGHLHLRFLNIQFGLAKLIVHHIARRTGVKPFIFR